MCKIFLPPNDWVVVDSHLKPKEREQKQVQEYARASFEILRYQMNVKDCGCSECRPGLLRRIFGLRGWVK